LSGAESDLARGSAIRDEITAAGVEAVIPAKSRDPIGR
jgi:hypothetical protein